MKRIPFVKMHGLGNDFVLLEEGMIEPSQYKDFAKRYLNRNFGIGGDGLLIIGKSENADISMRIFNPDGTEAQMCGNGIRCAVLFAKDKGMVNKEEITVETLSGIKRVWINDTGVKVDMGIPNLHAEEVPVKVNKEYVIDHPLRVRGRWFRITCLSMGNPHCVIFRDVTDEELIKFGPIIENHRIFPERINVEFVKVVNKSRIEVKVWERGAGKTLACGTGACASLVASFLNGLTEREAEVILPGGNLFIQWGELGHVFMTGPAEYVYEGEIILTK